MEIGEMLPLWSCIPFVGMLLSIAIFPLVRNEWWEEHQLHVAAVWSLLFLVPFFVACTGSNHHASVRNLGQSVPINDPNAVIEGINVCFFVF